MKKAVAKKGNLKNFEFLLLPQSIFAILKGVARKDQATKATGSREPGAKFRPEPNCGGSRNCRT